MKAFRAIIAFFQALLAFIGFGVIGVVLYSSFKSPYNVILALAVCILGLYLSRSIYIMMRRRGVIAVVSGDNASYDMDVLEPTASSGVQKLAPEELKQLFLENKVDFNNGLKVSIWGDWEGRKLDVRHIVNVVEYDIENKLLTIEFDDNCLLKVKGPSLILCSSNYLKIVKAKEVEWQIDIDFPPIHQYIYLNNGKEIKTWSNTTWKPHEFDIGIGMDAIYLQG
ncbi:hypothetical protein R3X28_16185 [Maribacter sp. TH_r10]|uniref:hypothetical protein n=1 Tax=Maribacter sp. TH_r10 TaxID=3082086 RepID=UPI002954A928|nr:hypothetical protein [Maribacter sp. TH_r10]MDV7140432.1 hypothetical protein [Maribacter sp. TH_r10]